MVDASSAHDAIQAQLIQYAAEITAACANQKPTEEDAATNRKVYIFDHNKEPVMAHFVTINGLTPADFKNFTDNYLANMKAMPPPEKGKPSWNALETIAGRQIAHHRMDPDVFMVSARSMIVTYYNVPVEDGHLFIVSSRGNADLEKKYAANIGKDVIGSLEINYMHFKQSANGTDVSHIVVSKPNGSIPDMVVKKMTAQQAKGILKMAEFLQKNKK